MIIGDRVHDYVDIQDSSKVSLAVSTTAAQTDQLDEGVYDVWCDDADVHIKVAVTANDVTTSTGYTIKQGNIVSVLIRRASRIGAILSAGTGTLYFHKIG